MEEGAKKNDNNLSGQPAQNNDEDSELNRLKKEKDEYLDGWQRAKAEFINYKKDEVKRFEALAKFANESIIRDLINILDSFDLAIMALERQTRIHADMETTRIDADTEKKKISRELHGFYLIRTQLEDALKNYGLERVIVSVGKPFDPAMQEAVAVVESNKPSGTIVEEIERGYTLNGKLIRPARVKVSK